MSTPFDEVIAQVEKQRYHNHRLEGHSDLVSNGIFEDLQKGCNDFKQDVEAGAVDKWLNFPAPGARNRKIDLLVAGPAEDGKSPLLADMRICMENKSVITAHRNRDARFDDLNEALTVLHRVKPEAILVATVLIGVAERVLNVPDQVKKNFLDDELGFMRTVLPRLSSGDEGLWTEYRAAISKNRPLDPQKTLEKFRQLPVRPTGHTHVVGYDFVLFVPVFIDNVNPPHVARENKLGINIDHDYHLMLERICRAYQTRWHLH
jgi:hypothetical protein